jgi:hypothetical protein
MKLIIAGSRDADKFSVLEAIAHCSVYGPFSPHEADEVVCGGAKGADTEGERWAQLNGIEVKYFIPDWLNKGKSAGHIRNREMGDYATHLLAVWDGQSKGTKGMIDYATKKGLVVYVHRY